MKLSIWFILISLIISAEARTVNFLLVEHPDALKILNVYRQQLNEQEKRALGEWLPFELKEVTTLSDNVTRVMETRVLNRTYFLLLDADGKPMNLEMAGAAEWINRATLLMDTVQVQPGYTLSLLNPVTKKEMATLPPGQSLVRIFQKGRQYFVTPLSSKPLFGFVKLPGQKAWKKMNRKEFNQTRNWQNFLENLQFLLNNKNTVYQKLFDFFKPQQDEKNPPQWQLKAEKDKVLLSFTRPELLNQWPKSTQLFLDEVETLARQNGFAIERLQDFTLIIKRSQK